MPLPFLKGGPGGDFSAEAYKNSTLREVSRSVIEPAEASAATAEISTLSLTCLCPEAWRSHRPRAEKNPFRTETASRFSSASSFVATTSLGHLLRLSKRRRENWPTRS